MERESDEVLRQMQRTESVSPKSRIYPFFEEIDGAWIQDMDDVKRQLQKYKKENNDLERELRG